jgi:hypothetical protein
VSGLVVVRAVLAADAGVTALVPASRIIADDVAPQGAVLPLILLRLISSTDDKPLKRGAKVMTRQRVQIEIHAADAATRKAAKKAVRSAVLTNPFPAVAGLSNVTLHTDGEGPDFFAEATSVRIGEQDVIVTYSEVV